MSGCKIDKSFFAGIGRTSLIGAILSTKFGPTAGSKVSDLAHRSR
jgi:hypothetical protein